MKEKIDVFVYLECMDIIPHDVVPINELIHIKNQCKKVKLTFFDGGIEVRANKSDMYIFLTALTVNYTVELH